MSTKSKKSASTKSNGSAPVAASAAVSASSSSSSSSSTSPIDPQQVKSCLLALYSHLQSHERDNTHTKQLLDEDQDILLTVALKKTPAKQHNKPIRLSIPHSLYNPARNPGCEICVFTKDPPAQKGDETPSSVTGIPLENPIKTFLAQHPVAGITKVLAISKLRANYHQFQERRKLLGAYSLFITDERIMPLLPPLLGARFYEKKKQPIPVNLHMHDFTQELIKVRDSTYMYINTGASLTIRISRTSFSRSESFENIMSVLPQIAKHLTHGWEEIQNIHVKSINSIALPIYNNAHSMEPLLADDPEKLKAKSNKKKGAAGEKKHVNKSSTKRNLMKKKRALSKKKSTESVVAAEQEENQQQAKKKQKLSNGGAASTSASAKKAAAPAVASSSSSTKKSSPTTPAKPAAASSATPAKPKSAKRARDESSSSAAASSSPAASAAVAPSAKQSKTPAKASPSADVVMSTTPVKSAASQKRTNAAVAKSAMKSTATPAKASTSQKKAPSTVASKKK